MSYKLDVVSTFKGETPKSQEKRFSRKKLDLNISFQELILGFMGFFLGSSIIMYETSPFIFPFIAYMVGVKRRAWIGLFSLLGLVILKDPLYIIRSGITFLCIYGIFKKYGKREIKTWQLALLSSLIVFFVGAIFLWIKEKHLYDFILILFESIITFIAFFIFNFAFPLIFGWNRRKVISNEELICGAILISLIFLGISNVEVLGFSIKNILGITFVLIFARYFGAALGSTTGVIVGVVTSLSSQVSPTFIGVYAFSGLLAGVFKDFGKLWVGLGFILGNAVLTFYINGSTDVFIHIEETLVAIILLLLLPKSIGKRISSLKGVGDYQIERERLYGERIRNATINRLKGYSQIFNQIGKSFEQVALSNTLQSKNDFDEIFDRLTQGVCYKCSYFSRCWERNFNNAYQNIFYILNQIERTNGIFDKEMADLDKICIHPSKLIQELNCLYGNYKSNQYWKGQALESKKLISQQMKGISKVIMDLGLDMGKDILFNKEIEEEILVALDKNNIGVRDVVVIEEPSGRFEVTIYGQDKLLKNGKSYSEVGNIISDILGRKMIIKGDFINNGENNEYYKLNYKEAVNYNINIGVVKVAKDPLEESGDSYTSILLKDDKHMLALSDGMGSGLRAAKESKTTINLLENFFEAGFNKEIALKTINSILMLRSSDEMFSTIDLTIFDKYSGEAEFIKIGAVSTFIKTQGKVDVIESSSLPIGILEEINIGVKKRKLQDGDIIVMLTDGALDSNYLVVDKEKWFMDELMKASSRNPQRIAEILFEKVRKVSKNNLRDDTTILVGKIWGNIN